MTMRATRFSPVSPFCECPQPAGTQAQRPTKPAGIRAPSEQERKQAYSSVAHERFTLGKAEPRWGAPKGWDAANKYPVKPWGLGRETVVAEIDGKLYAAMTGLGASKFFDLGPAPKF